MEKEYEYYPDDLLPGEKVLWRGQPKQGILLRDAEMYNLPFSLACAWILYEAVHSVFINILRQLPQIMKNPTKLGDHSFLCIFPFFAILMGLYFAFFRFIADWYTRKNTFYAITNLYIRIWVGAGYQTESTLRIDQLPEVIFKRGRNGSGSLVFGESHPFSWQNYLIPIRYIQQYYEAPTFGYIPDVDEVLNLIRSIRPELKFHELIA